MDPHCRQRREGDKTTVEKGDEEFGQEEKRCEESSGIGLLQRISRLAATFLRADIVYARGKARMSKSQNPQDACNAAVLSAGGIVTAAALSCLAEVDLQVIAADATPLSDSAPSSSTTSPSPYLHGYGGISLIDYTEYFLPASQRDKVRTEGNVSRWKASPIFPLCSPVVRTAALEAYVRICFAQYLILVDKQRKLASDPAQKPFLMKTNELSAFINSAVDAVLMVVNTDPQRATRRRAAITLLHAIQNAPSGQSAFAAYSLGEPWLCAGWADTDALLLQHPGGINSAVAAARQVISSLLEELS